MNESDKTTQAESRVAFRPSQKRERDGQRCRQTWPCDERSRNIDTKLPPGYQRDGEHVLVRMPATPQTASPVPHLTSLHASDGHGPYGKAAFRGNCSGLLIRDLLLYFRPKLVLDPMSGSGTCRDVCQELELPCVSFDLAQGLDACDEANYQRLAGYDFIWIHPPYWKLIEYGHDPRCLSQAPTLDDYLQRMRQVLRNCKSVLSPNGRIALLIGDGRERGEYWGLPFRTLQAAESEGLWLAAPEIIRFGHGSTSSRKEYTSSFIPLLHDVCWVLKAAD